MSQRPNTGAYILLISVDSSITISIGKIGPVEFRPGWYTYVGSAMGLTATSLHHRLQRHFAPVTQKRLHWHIDYLLASPHCNVAGALTIPSLQKLECQVVARIQLMGGLPWGPRFGSSDCTSCASHLLFLNPLDAETSPEQMLGRIQKEMEKSGDVSEIQLKQ
jgi:Uri superfamily endonuclease